MKKNTNTNKKCFFIVLIVFFVIVVSAVLLILSTQPIAVTWGEEIIAFQTLIDKVTLIWFLAVVVVAVLVVAITVESRTRLRQEVENVKLSEEQFRIVARQSGRQVLRYDIPTRRLVLPDGRMTALPAESTAHPPESGGLTAGTVVSSSEEDYRAFWERVNAGESPVNADIQCRRSDGSRGWYRYSSVTQNNKQGEAKTAVISFYDCTVEREHEQAYIKWQQDIDEMRNDKVALFEWNLTQDVSERSAGALLPDFEAVKRDTFNDYIAAYAAARVYAEDREAYRSLLNRERLLNAYHEGAYRAEMDYRAIQDDGSLRWMNMGLQLVPSTDGKSIKVYTVYHDVNNEKKERLALLSKSQTDAMTGVLNRATFIQKVSLLFQDEPDAVHALLMLDLDGFKTINDTLGHDTGDRVLVNAAHSLRGTLRAGDLIGRMGGDEFVICLKNIPFEPAIAKKAVILGEVVRTSSFTNIPVTTSIGIAVFPRDGLKFDELYQKADSALYAAKNKGRGNYVIHGAEQDHQSGPAQGGETGKFFVLLVSECAGLAEPIQQYIGTGYRLLRAANLAVLRAQLHQRGAMFIAVILEGDSPLGQAALKEIHQDIRRRGLAVLGIVKTLDNTVMRMLSMAGVSFVLPRDSLSVMLPAQLDMLRTNWYSEQRRFNEAYSRLQSQDEWRYNEVLRATGTSVFIYDMNTGACQADLSPERYTDVVFSGSAIWEELRRSGIADDGDITAAQGMVMAVGSGQRERDSMNIRLTTRNGQKRWFSLQAIRLCQTDALTVKVLITVNDANERLNAEQLRIQFLDNLPCGAAMFRMSRRHLSVVYINKRYMELVGRSGDAIQRHNVMLSIHPKDQQPLLDEIFEALEKKRDISSDVRIINGEGAYTLFHFTGRIVSELNENYLIYGTYQPLDRLQRDITKMLPVSMAAMMRSSPDMIFVKDINLRYICASRAFAAETLVKDEKEIPGKTDYDLFADRALAEKYRADDLRMMESGQSLPDYTEAIPPKDGVQRTTITSKYLLYDDDGRVVGLYCVSRQKPDERGEPCGKQI